MNRYQVIQLHAWIRAQAIDYRINERANHPLPVYKAPVVIRWLALGLPPISKAGGRKVAA